MTPKHTPEPWHIRPSLINPEDGAFYLHSVRNGLVARIETDDSIADEANAERIVACVNALAGLNPEAVADALAAFTSIVLTKQTGARVLDSQWAAANAALTKLKS